MTKDKSIPNFSKKQVPQAEFESFVVAKKSQVNLTHNQCAVSESRTIDITPLISVVLRQFPIEHPLRTVLAAERTTLTVQEFLSKLETWNHLLRAPNMTCRSALG